MNPHRLHAIHRLYITIIALLLSLNPGMLSSASWAQAALDDVIVVKTQVDRTEISIGDKLRYKITVDAVSTLEIELPELGENLGGFEIRDFGRTEPKMRKGNSVLEQWYLLDIYTTGTYTIPAPLIRYTDATGTTHDIEGKEIKVEVKSVLSEDSSGEIKDISPPTDLPGSYRSLILYLVVAAVLLATAIVAIRYFRRRKLPEDEPVARPAHEIAYERLEALNALQLIERKQIEEYYVGISDTIRSYLENQFELKAPEMTTEEFLVVAASESNLKNEHKTLLSEFLTNCDLVKFARHGPNLAEIKSACDAAKQFVDETAAFFVDEDMQ